MANKSSGDPWEKEVDLRCFTHPQPAHIQTSFRREQQEFSSSANKLSHRRHRRQDSCPKHPVNADKGALMLRQHKHTHARALLDVNGRFVST